MLSNNSYIRGIHGIIKNEVISNLRLTDFKDYGCESFLTTKEYVDYVISHRIGIESFFYVNGFLIAYDLNTAPSNPVVDDFYYNSNGNLYQYSTDWTVYSASSDEINLLYNGRGQQSAPSGLVVDSSVVSFFDPDSDHHFSKNKINSPEPGHICIFTFDYEPDKANTLRIYTNPTKWTDLLYSDSFTLQKNSSDYLSVSFSFDKFKSRIVKFIISPFFDSNNANLTTIDTNSNDIIPLTTNNPSSNIITVSNPISTLLSYYSYSGTSSVVNDYNSSIYNPMQFYFSHIGTYNNNTAYIYNSPYSYDTITVIPNSSSTPTMMIPGFVIASSFNNFNNNDIILVQSLSLSSDSDPVETNVNYPYLVSISDNVKSYNYISCSNYDTYFNKDTSLLCKFTISPSSDSTPVNNYSIKLVSSPDGPFLTNYDNNAGIWSMEDTAAISYIKH